MSAARESAPSGRWVVLSIKLILAGCFVVPLWLGVAAAFRPEGELFRFGDRLSLHTFIPAAPTLENFSSALNRPGFLRQIGNTLFVAITVASGAAALATLAAFPIARMRFRWREMIFVAILATIFIPFEAVLVPLYLVVRDFGLVDTWWGLMLPAMVSPVGVFLMRQAMMEVPVELDEAAMLDGAGAVEILRTAILPNVWPAVVTVWLFSFVTTWNWLLWPLAIIKSPDKQVIQVGILGYLQTVTRVPYADVFAATVLSIGPVLIAFLALQRFYVSGVAMTGINK